MLLQTAILLAAAVLCVPLTKRLGLGTVPGYVLAGVLIGPSLLGLVHDVHETLHFAEFGVVMLLFLIGLELAPARLWAMRGRVFGLGTLQVLLTALVGAGIAMACGLSMAPAVIVGIGLALSSTAFVMQLLAEKRELTTKHGQTAFGVLLFQDLAAIPTLAAIPLLSAQAGAESSGALVQLGLAVGALVGLVVMSRLVLRPLFRIVASTHSHELSTALTLLVVVGTALAMEAAGLSMALGAFLSGVLLADSEYRHELEANIDPFKGLLMGLFFMAVGMSADMGVLLTRPLAVLGVVSALVLGKGLILLLVARQAKLEGAAAWSLAVLLSQGGEFAFVLFGAGATSGLLEQPLVDLLIVSVTLSMAITPVLVLLRDVAIRRLEKAGTARPFDTIEGENPRVIIAGFGRFGQIVSRTLRARRIRFTALEKSPTQVDFVRRFGNRIYYGDAARMDLLRTAGIEQAEVFVLAVDDPEESVRVAEAVRHAYPDLRIVARARNRAHAYALMGLGIKDVIRETFHSSLEAAALTLEAVGLPAVQAREAVERFRDHDEAAVRDAFHHRGDEAMLIETAKRTAEELEKLFEDDAARPS
ncbi:MAG: cation:proton antiporter [Sandaracinaceae bacterium]|jgi:glutathione-regulated potassium-efflux system ancillary protein KefC|nr:cation:proton antiporter [Sandaracinaceae bacterium]